MQTDKRAPFLVALVYEARGDTAKGDSVFQIIARINPEFFGVAR